MLDAVYAYLFLLVLLIIGLSIPPAIREEELKNMFKFFCIAFIQNLFGIILPFLVFFFSAFAIPEWKGGCYSGWYDCIDLGKIAFLPLLLWSYKAFYVVQILKPEQKKYLSINSLGILSGLIVNLIWFISWLVIYLSNKGPIWSILFPFYIFVWFLVLFKKTIKKSELNLFAYVKTVLLSLSLYLISIFWSIKIYYDLPDTEPPPPCFVVTAANRGHDIFVGPFHTIERRGIQRTVNTQLINFWRFENIWSKRLPVSHKLFRKSYNQLGPVLASRIRTKYTADVVYILLKPFELTAVVCTFILSRTCSRTSRLSSSSDRV